MSGDCTSCAYGQYQGSVGSPLCVACDPGQFTSIDTLLTVCSPCAEGRWQPASGSNDCLDCVSGQYQGAQGVTGCIDCSTGKFDHDSDPTTACRDCVAGYTADPGAYTCYGELCLNDLTMPNSSTVCSGRTDEECQFVCDQGYSAVRPRMCMPNRAFLGGQCTADSCYNGRIIGNSSVMCQGVTEEQCQFNCDCGYTPQGLHMCNTDGVFRGGTCTACPTGHVGRGLTCSVCANGFKPSVTSCDCIPCQD